GHEPSSMRGLQHGFDPYQQVKHRLSQLREIGHRPSKIELIIRGGTFPATPSRYQRHFVRRCLDAISGSRSSTLDEAKRRADSGATRNVGITVETRPDMCGPKEVDLMLSYGATRVEIGVQTLYDDIYEINERGHTVQDVVNAFQTAKDAGLKVVAHMMPGLPGSDFKRDLEAFRTLFEDERFKPDMIKIYPCLILVGSKIYDWWLRGLYTPYGVDEAVELIAEVKKMIPPWIRIMRVQRDIPARMIVAGVKKSNLRQLVQEKLLCEGYRCRCIRCREIGHLEYKENVKIDPEELVLKSIEYGASGGREYFISIEDDRREALIGYARLRIPSERAHRREIKGGSAALVRELHVLGPSTPIGEKDEAAYQHKGFGKRLLKEAERVACVEEGCVKIVVTSGLGVKEYYRRQGYSDDGPYMSKIVNANDY
ncbi:MAG: tRNA uridine(34) 5-carboxymethylaminomethyl modification radical SAM/GNAT enzyme Elp3, partial [Candidatus Bathyarchaeia archaeon]